MDLSTTIGTVLSKYPKKLVSLPYDAIVQDAINALNSSNISALPILSDDKQNLYGFVDILDILAFLAQTCTKNLSDTATGESFHITTDDMKMMMKRQRDFRLKHVGELIDFSKRNPFVTMDKNTTIRDAIETFSKEIHRIAVTSNKEMIGMLSQSDFITYLANDLMKFEKFKELTIKDCNNKTTDVLCVPEEMIAIDSFLTMYQKGKSSIAITRNGKLCGTLSASDIRVANIAFDISKLLKSTHDFMKEGRQTKGKDAECLVSCTIHATLAEVVHKMNKEMVHRVFIVDQAMKPLGVLSITDLMKELNQLAAPTSH